MLTFFLCLNAENHREKYIRVEKELKKEKDEVLELGKLLETESRHNSLLERNLRATEQNLEETVRTKDMKIVSLTAELNGKAGTIAHLTKQLHDSKVACAELNDRLSTNQLILDRDLPSPAPPGERPPASGRRRFARKVPASNGAVNVETLKNGGNPSSQKILFNIKTAKSSDGFPARSVRSKTPTSRTGRHAKSMPSGDAHSLSGHPRVLPDDYTEFLKTGSKPEPKLVYKPVPNPLPPILNGVENGVTTQASYKVHRSRGQDTGMVDEILVSPLNSPDKSWRQGSSHYDPVS